MMKVAQISVVEFDGYTILYIYLGTQCTLIDRAMDDGAELKGSTGRSLSFILRIVRHPLWHAAILLVRWLLGVFLWR